MKGYSLTNCEEIHLDDAGERCCNCYEMRGKSETSESHYRMNLMKNRENDTKEKESASVAKEERLLLLCEPNALANEAANSQEENAKCQRGPNQNSKIHGEIIDEIDGDKDITCNIITSDTKKIPDAVPASGVSNKVTMECLTSAEEAGLQIEHKYAEGCINAENSEKTPDDETKPSKIAGKNNSSLMTEEEEEGEKELSERSSKDRKESENCSSECQNLTNSGRSESVERHNEDISQERRSCDASTERAQSSKKLKHHPHSKHQPSSSHRHRSLQRKGSRFHKKNDRAADSDSASSFVASSKNSAHERNDREDFSVDSLEVSEASEMTASVDRSVYSRSSRSLSHSSVSPASVSASQSRSPSRSPSSSFTEHERFNSEDERFDECNERKRRSGVKRQQSGYSKGENKDNYLSSTRHSRPRYGDRTKRESVRGEKQGRKNGERRYSSCDSDSESRTRSRRSDDEYRSSRKEFDRDEMSDESIVSQSPEEQSICERRRKSRK
ncbi:uncharacterized protein MONOS_1602 [Monocercomonoides exilis]|uniref:uncharacterized protein n=1 Tax=Monocercomonoides exilis TaxID=2049356 RepID=UPI00355A8908|nr:hypothetical protein MONOS_1602 [Monocercomonoides exilis]|eukprot:MONOS_1602.1-p1 / transcript=MONOS_1602.1 / gene=MONOS_1602 / organism=Monocercomonoides_exilis_PA203 / gene_product=unspecified product / transcript_product=unspecified product / location=Mono_scaffold00029:36675-38177(+) / protein_length=501 / sequence_SO=supercontig / SO=protein_coding / is_pseudo=false